MAQRITKRQDATQYKYHGIVFCWLTIQRTFQTVFSFINVSNCYHAGSQEMVTSNYLLSCCEQVLFLAASVCASVRKKSRKLGLLIRNWCNLVWICAVSFKLFKLATSFSVWGYIFKISRPPSSFKVMRSISRSRVAKKRQRADMCTLRTQLNCN